MAWSVPLTAVSNATLTASQWNASVRDNLLETGPAKVTAAGQYLVSTAANALATRVPQVATVATSENTTSTSYTNLTTPGPTVTVTTGSMALVFVSAKIVQSTATASVFQSFAVSGATTVAADDRFGTEWQPEGANRSSRGTSALMVTGLTSGSNTFTQQYRVSGGTGSFALRQISVLPF
jgi:hypothetical protein